MLRQDQHQDAGGTEDQVLHSVVTRNGDREFHGVLSTGLHAQHPRGRIRPGWILLQPGVPGTRYTRSGMKAVLLWLIDAYKLLLSPFFGQQCRFYPTCSTYAREAIEVHGSLRGSWLAIKRIVKCAPWHPGGVDPVPPRGDRVNRDP